MDDLFDILLEIIIIPFRMLLHGIVRSLGGSNPRYFLIWKYGCRFFMLLAVVIFFGAIVGIITQLIGPFTMFWMLVGSPVLLMVASSASDAVVWEPPKLKAPLEPAQQSDQGLSSRE